MKSIKIFLYIFALACMWQACAESAQKADLVIMSYDRPLQLYAFLESVSSYMSGLGEVVVVYKTSNDAYKQAYEEVRSAFPLSVFCKEDPAIENHFKELWLKATFDSSAEYILFAVDDIVVKDHIDIANDIELMNKHEAYGFYYRLGFHLSYCHPMNCKQRVPPLKRMASDLFAWTFRDGECDWGYPHTVDMTLYRKADIEKDLRSIDPFLPSFEWKWSGLVTPSVKNKIGLCYKISKIVNLPLNRVQEEICNRNMGIEKDYLLEQFMQGKKIDITPLFKIKNPSAHMDYEPIYIQR